MPETPDNYLTPEDLQDLENQGSTEDPEINQNIGEFQEWTAEHEQNVMNGIHNADMGELANYNIPEQEEMQPPMYAAEGMELPEEQQTFEGGAGEDTYNLEEPEPALPTDEERYEEEGGAPGQGFGA